jgi:hypothetical protein
LPNLASDLTADIEAVLRFEFDAGPKSFLFELYEKRRWDDRAFARLTEAMRQYLQVHPPADSLPRWIAEGFWYLDWFVQSWTKHPAFEGQFPDSYYEEAYDTLNQLAYWLFVGEPSSDEVRGYVA